MFSSIWINEWSGRIMIYGFFSESPSVHTWTLGLSYASTSLSFNITTASCFPSICHDFVVHTLGFPPFHLSTLWDFHFFICPQTYSLWVCAKNVHECPKMSWNVQLCPEMSHPCPRLDVVSCILWKSIEVLAAKSSCSSTAPSIARHGELAKFIWKNVSSYVV